MSISCWWIAISDFCLPLALHNMGNRSAEFLNLKIHVYSLRNFATMLCICWAISISSFKAAILNFRLPTVLDISISGLWAAILDFWLPLASHSMGNIFIEFLENISFAVGTLQLCCIHAEILVFPLWEPPSWISDFRLHHTVWKIASLSSWTKQMWVVPLELCSYLAYNLSYCFLITAICSRHLGFLSDNIDAIILCHFLAQPYLGKVTRAFRLVPCGSEMAAKRSARGGGG